MSKKQGGENSDNSKSFGFEIITVIEKKIVYWALISFYKTAFTMQFCLSWFNVQFRYKPLHLSLQDGRSLVVFYVINHLVLLDLSKASDMFDYLSSRELRVRLRNVLSNQVAVFSGILLGSIIEPVLFTLFINDLSSVFRRVIPESIQRSYSTHMEEAMNTEHSLPWREKY